MRENNILYSMIIAVGIILGMVTLVTKGAIGIVVLTLLFIVMSCAEIYWWSRYQDATEELKMFKYNYEQASIEAREKRAVGLKLLSSIGNMKGEDANKKIQEFLKEANDTICICGHSQQEHGFNRVCRFSSCKCTSFMPVTAVKQ